MQRKPREPLEGTVIKRLRKRRLMLDTLDGLARAHATIIRRIVNGDIPIDEGNAASLAMSRHSIILKARDELKLAQELNAQLTALNARGQIAPALPAPEAASAEPVPAWALGPDGQPLPGADGTVQ